MASTSALRLSLSAPSLFAWVFGLAAVIRIGVLLYSDFVLDDAYITMRVARNLATGDGFVYNVGERVQACSSPLWALICAALWRVTSSHALFIAQAVGGLCDAAAAGILVLLLANPRGAGERGTPRDGTVGGLLAGSFYAGLSTSVLIVTGGLETGLYVLVIALSLYFMAKQSWSTAAICGGIAVLTRPDGLSVALTVWLFACTTRKRLPWKQVALTSVIAVPYLMFAAAYYGQIVPQSVLAKSGLFRSSAEQWANLGWKWFWGSPVQWLMGSLFMIGLWLTLHHRRDLRAAAFWVLGFAGAFSTLASWWPWYWPPAMFGYALFAGLGFDFVVNRVRIRASTKWIQASAWAVCAGVFALVTAKTSLGAIEARRHTAQFRPYLETVGHRLAELSSPIDTVMTEPLGLLGFYSGRTFRDFPGLASPTVSRAIKDFRKPVYGKPDDPAVMRYVLDRVRPSVLVLREDEYQALSTAGILGDYAVIEMLPLGTPPHSGLASMYILRSEATTR